MMTLKKLKLQSLNIIKTGNRITDSQKSFIF